YSLRRGAGGRSPFPTIGYNARNGFYVSKRMELVDRPDYTVTFDGGLALKRGLLGGVEGLQSNGRLRWLSALQVREQAPNQRVRFLEFDRLPEIGVMWAPKPDVRTHFLPTQVQNVDRAPEDQ